MSIKLISCVGICLVAAALSISYVSIAPNSAPVEDQQSSASTLQRDTGQSDSPEAQSATSDRARLAHSIEAVAELDYESIDAEVDRIRQEMIIDRYFEQVDAQSVSDELIAAHYVANADQFTTREIDLSHILLKAPGGISDEESAALMTRAQEIKARLHSGESFAALARELSDDEYSAANEGLLGRVGENDMLDNVMQIALNLAPGKISQPVVTPYGIHILRADSLPRDVQRSLADVRPYIIQTIRAQARADAVSQLASNP